MLHRMPRLLPLFAGLVGVVYLAGWCFREARPVVVWARTDRWAPLVFGDY